MVLCFYVFLCFVKKVGSLETFLFETPLGVTSRLHFLFYIYYLSGLVGCFSGRILSIFQHAWSKAAEVRGKVSTCRDGCHAENSRIAHSWNNAFGKYSRDGKFLQVPQCSPLIHAHEKRKRENGQMFLLHACYQPVIASGHVGNTGQWILAQIGRCQYMESCFWLSCLKRRLL